MVVEGLQRQHFPRLTLDFDGSVQSTKGNAEGTAVGFNKAKKGARSYYPLFCTVAQTAQFFDVRHLPGNVHDSNGAAQFMLDCFDTVTSQLRGTILESRMDSAFFNQDIISMLSDNQVKFTASVPFERFSQLKKSLRNANVGIKSTASGPILKPTGNQTPGMPPFGSFLPARKIKNSEKDHCS